MAQNDAGKMQTDPAIPEPKEMNLPHPQWHTVRSRSMQRWYKVRYGENKDNRRPQTSNQPQTDPSILGTYRILPKVY